MKSSEAKAQFRKVFERLAYRHDYSTVFSDFLDYALLMMRWDKKAEDFAELEKRWTKKEEHEGFAELLQYYSIVADNDGEGFYDGLGDLFMELISFGRNGQFFTPTDVCNMMALVTTGGSVEDGQTVCDPTCGSGRTLLAVAKINRKAIFYGADVDLTCCKMSVLNMLINCMEGEVAWMNTLSMEHYRSWHLKTVLDGTGHYLPYYIVTGKNETHFVERLKNSMNPEPAKAPMPPMPMIIPTPPMPPAFQKELQLT